jgi:hypothetical protein
MRVITDYFNIKNCFFNVKNLRHCYYVHLCIGRNSDEFKNKCICLMDAWFIFNLQIIKKKSVTSIHTQLIKLLINMTCWITLCFIHSWVARPWQHRSEWVHLCSLLKGEWVFSLTTWDRMLSSFPSIAWLGLPRSCCWLLCQLKHL